jgi:biofilm protein TabA
MYIGPLANWDEQRAVLPAAVVKAVEAVRQHDLSALAVGRHEIDGAQAFFMIQEMPSRDFAKTQPEAHQRYADVQIVLAGPERYGVASADPELISVDDRLERDDIAFYPAPKRESFIDLDAGGFAVFLPGELHRPCCAIGASVPLRKVVVKIHRSLLGL